ncbi:hypothetical protein BKI52_24720 [marine bacterium AO1-C]|nr:hypothetical protein BKI52_24720 [marine bacterium AO1-C]
MLVGCLIGSLSSCNSSNDQSQKGNVTSDSTQNTSKNYFKDQVKVKYARNFQVEYHGNYKVVKLLKPFEDADDGMQYALVQRGTPAPKGFKESEIIEIPIRKIITLSHTHVAFIQQLGQINSVQGVSVPQYLTNATLIDKHKKKQLVVAGSGMELNTETILAAQPDMVMASGMASNSYKKYQTLISAGVPLIINSEWLERTPLGRAEWLKFVALFYNLEKEANATFNKIETAYQKLVSLTAKVTKKPKVVVGLPFKGTWYMPRGGSFVGQYLKDAGADYYWKNEQGVGSMPLDFEAVYGKALKADFWMVNSSVKTLQGIKDRDTRFGDFEAFKTQKVYNNNKKTTSQGVNIFFNNSVVHPDWVLADMVKILHPDLLPEHELVYYQKLPLSQN